MKRNLLILFVICFISAGSLHADLVQIKSCDFDQLSDIMDLGFYYPGFTGSGTLDDNAALGAKSLQLTTGKTFQNVDGQIGVLNECVVDFYFYMGTDDNSSGNIDYNRLDFMNNDGKIFAGLGFKPDGTGTGTFGLQMFSSVSGYFTPLVTGIPVNSWEHLRVTISITNTTVAKPLGILKVERELAGNWEVIVQENFTSFSDFTGDANKGVMRCKFFANDITWNIDEVKIGVNADNINITPDMPLGVSFYDNFETDLSAYWGSAGTYAVLTTEQAVSGVQSVIINDAYPTVEYLAKPISSTTEAWIDLQLRVKSGSGNTGPYAGIDFKGIASDTSYKIPLGFHYKIEGSGYGLYLLDGRTGYYTQLVTNLPLDTWKHFKIGARMLSPGTGIFWVYMQNGETWDTIAQAIFYVAYQQLDTAINQVQFTTHGNSIYIDDFTVGNPLYCGMGGTEYSSADFNKDCYVDFSDFGDFAESWMDCTDPANDLCD